MHRGRLDLCQTAEFGSCIPAAVDKHIGDWEAISGVHALSLPF